MARRKGKCMNDLLGEALNPILSSPQFKLGTNLCGLFIIVFYLALVFWTWRDADRRGAMAWFWAIVVLLFNVAGWAIYMVMRPPEFADDVHERELEIAARETEIGKEGARCPSCLKPVEGDFLICPYCMKKLKKQCINCSRPLKMSWGVCPYCKTKQQMRDEPNAPRVTPGRGKRPSSSTHVPPAPEPPAPADPTAPMAPPV
jgi:hypothetical protein